MAGRPRTWSDRLDMERRLLAALFLWPVAVDLAPRHFLSAMHGVLFGVVQELGNRLLDEHKALPAMRAVLARDELADMFKWQGGIDEYVITQLIPASVTPHAVPDLVSLVRECPRCGR